MNSIHIVGEPKSPQHRLIRMLEAIAPVSDTDKAAIERGLKGTLRKYQAHEAIAKEGDRPSSCAIMVEGFAYRCHYIEAGSRQIHSFHIPGDIPDVQSLYLKTMDHSVETLDRAEVLHVDHAAMFELMKEAPALIGLFWRGTLIEASVFRQWITNIGQREAPYRIAHMLCELFARLQSVGLTDGMTCRVPLTQGDIADATGLSTVHINRSLQRLRADGLLDLRAGSLTVKNWDGLVEVAGFDPAYLHLSASPLQAE